MFDWIIQRSLEHRWLVLAAALLVVVTGSHAALTMPVDVLPDLSAPTVTVVSEASGMAPEEVEKQVTVPLEQTLNGAPGVRRIRSSSGVGISLIWVEFDWDVDQLLARQTVAEKLATSRSAMPRGVEPVMAPASSIMGEIMFVGLVGDGQIAGRELRDVAEWQIRRRLLALPGIAQVVPIGGALKQVQIRLRPHDLVQHGLGASDVLEALEDFSSSAPGGFYVSGAQEYLVRAVGRVTSLASLEQVRVGERDGVPILVRDVADVTIGEAMRRGEAAVDGRHAVVMKIQKQPGADTLALTDSVDRALDDVARDLPSGMTLHRKGFRQAQFIRVAVKNVLGVLRDAAILVLIVLALFLMSWRTTLISIVALPLSLLVAILVLEASGASINTMTLGGLAIAIGELVDDAIIDVENVHRRLRENAALPELERLSSLVVVFRASREIRSSVVFATLIVILASLPLFFLSGLEGRLLQPLGVAYVTSIAASLLVALTVTPVGCLLLLGRVGPKALEESRLARFIKSRYRPIVAATLHVPVPIALAALGGAVAAIVSLLSLGRTFLPEFNEGSLNIAAATAPGTSLETSDQIVARLEQGLLRHPAVTSVVRMTGRAERDEHALDVNFSELEVGLEMEGSDRETVLREVRELAGGIPGLSITVGQPISHRIEHMVSGSRASLAVKIFADDLDQLRRMAGEARGAMATVPGIVDLNVEQQTQIPELVIRPRSVELAAFGRTPGELSRFVTMAFVGQTVAAWWEGDRAYDVVVRLPELYRSDMALLSATPIDARGERFTELSQVADIQKTLGPNLINRENSQRRIVVTANIEGSDLVGSAQQVERAIDGAVRRPAGAHIVLGGQFESEARASRSILILSTLALIGVLALLAFALRSVRAALVVLLNLPLALVGGVIAVWAGAGVLSIASLVGFITLFGIASRNGIMMVTHFQELVDGQGVPIDEAVVQGSVDRVIPILMTALTAALALIPIALSAGEPGNEIQAPMAAVILGGLSSSTLLNLVVVPAVYARFARRA